MKTIWDQNGKNEKPKESAKIFHQMALLYQKQSTNMFSLIRSAALYNAALVRWQDNVLIIEDLKKLCKDVLSKADAQDKNADLIKLAKAVKQKFECMRSKVKQKLLNIPVSKINNLDKELPAKECQDKIRNVRELQKRITADYIRIMSELSDTCIAIMGDPPCKFALVGMGSLARQEITPFSNFEHIIVLEEISQQTADKKESILNYFRWYSVIFHIIIINIQETIIPSVAIPSLNNHPKYGNWFYDKLTIQGVSFDGMMPHACKFPFLNREPTKNKPLTTELIKPVSEMLDCLTCEQDLKNGYRLRDIFTKVCYVNGEKSIFRVIEKREQEIFDDKIYKTVQNEIRKVTNKDLEYFGTRKYILDLKSYLFLNFKNAIYRSTTLFVSAFGRLNYIHASSYFDIVEQLEQINKISSSSKNELLFAIALACETRLKWYTEWKFQNNTMKTKSNTQNAIQLLSNEMGKANVYHYFKITYALQCGLTKELYAKNFHFYSNPIMLNCILFHCLGDDRKLNNYKLSYLIFKQNNPEKLYTIDDCLILLNKHAREKQNQKTSEPAISDMASKHIEFDIKEILLKFQNDNEIKKYFEISTYALEKPELNKKNVFSVILYDYGIYLTEMDKPTAAMDCFQKSLEIDKTLSGNPQNDPNIAVTLDSIGECFMKRDEPTEAMDHFQKSLEIKQRLSGDPVNDRSLSITLHSIGKCLMEIDSLTEATDYFQKSFKIQEQLSNDPQNDRSLADNLHSMAKCLMRMDKLTEAMDHLQKSFEIDQRLLDDPQNDRNLSITLQSMGECLMKLDKPTEAMNHFQKSLDIKQRLSSNPQNDSNIAVILQCIDKCSIKMDKPSEAIDYF